MQTRQPASDMARFIFGQDHTIPGPPVPTLTLCAPNEAAKELTLSNERGEPVAHFRVGVDTLRVLLESVAR